MYFKSLNIIDRTRRNAATSKPKQTEPAGATLSRRQLQAIVAEMVG